MRVLGIVPARAGSKRLPDKNVLVIGGRSMARRAIDCALAARSIDRVVVSSDDPRVLAIAREVDPSLALERPPELCTDTSMAIDYVKHAFATLEAAGEAPFDVVAIVQPSSPFTTPEDVDATVALLETGAASAASVVELDHAIQPVKLKRMDDEGRLLPYLEQERGRMAAHQLPTLFVRNGSVYVSRRAVIEAGQILSEDCRGHVMPRERSIDINDELDLRFAEFLCASST